MINHIGTETWPKLVFEAAVRNIGQWTNVWSSNTTWMKKVFSDLKVLSMMKIMTLFIKEVPTNLVPAVAVIRGGLALFYVTGCKAY
jgi:hypothetical protein